MSYLWGSFPERTSIRTQGNSLGHTLYLRAESETIARAAVVGTRHIDSQLVMQNLVATAAGPAAEAMVMGDARTYPFPWTTYGGMRDHQIATTLMTAAGDLLHTSLNDLVEEAFDLLELPRIWTAVDAVARELMRYEELDYNHLQLIVIGATGEKEVAPPRPKPDRVAPAGTRSWSSGRVRVLSKHEAWQKIAENSPRGAAQVKAWRKGESADMRPVERR